MKFETQKRDLHQQHIKEKNMILAFVLYDMILYVQFQDVYLSINHFRRSLPIFLSHALIWRVLA